MDLRDWTFFVAAMGHLTLALMCVFRSGRAPLALPLSLLAFDLFGWSFATFCHHRLGGVSWRELDAAFTGLSPAFVLHVVLVFVGRLRTRLHLLWLAYAGFGALALSAFVFSGGGGEWIESQAWAALFLASLGLVLGYGTVCLVSHLRAEVAFDEQARTRLMLAALLVGGAFASTDVWSDLGVPVPGLAPLGTLASTVLIAIVALRLQLFESNIRAITTLYAVSVAVGMVLTYLTVVQGLRGNLPALTFGLTVVTLVLAAIVREVTTAVAGHRDRLDRLAVIGRFSAQMAHDLANPLAALDGAVQVLDGLPPGDAHERELRALITEQVRRIRSIVERYDRLGRVDPVRSVVNLNTLVTRVTALQRHAAGPDVGWSLDLDPTMPDCDLDPDLVSGALENLIRNALEAIVDGGTLRIGTAFEKRNGVSAALVLRVSDDGEGMDARQAERAFDDFYTTKSTGSGLGLAFVRRVALVHGGDASLASKRGVGTTVEVRFRAG